jgi:hypothetical protein
VIVHPQYNAIVETGFDAQRIFGKALWYSLLHLISNDYCSQWDPTESISFIGGHFDRNFKPAWKTSISFLLHSHSLGYMRAKLGTTMVTQQAEWRDGMVGEFYGENRGLFCLHEDVMNRLDFELENQLDISQQQSEYFTNNNEFEGRFIDVMRSLIIISENIIDEIMEDQETIAIHTVRRGVIENSDDENSDDDNSDDGDVGNIAE